MGSNPVTLVANSLHRHDQSIDLGIYDSDTALRPDWNEAALRHAGNTSVVVFVEEHSVRVRAVHHEKRWRKYHLSDVAGKCTDQSVVIIDTTPHVYGKAMLVVDFDGSMRIITIPLLRVTTFSACSILKPRTCVAGWNCVVGLFLTPIWFVSFSSPTRPILTAMESTIQETPIYGIVIILMELSKATTNIAFP